MMKFHWAMDFTSHQNDYDFGAAMEECLNEAGKINFKDDWKVCRKKYRILPNYWGGFSTHKENYYSAGEAEITIRKHNNLQRITGWCHNMDSCEKYSFSYCQNEDGELEGKFESEVENFHKDIYKKVRFRGQRDGKNVFVETDAGVRILGENVEGSVYSGWQFLHKLPAETSKGSFCILEKLENFYKAQSISKIEDWNWGKNKYEVYALRGRSQPFTYYFTESRGNVIIAVHTLMTYVLEEAEFD